MAKKRMILVAFLCIFIIGAQSGTKTYSADRFDVELRLEEDGSMWVRETVVFRFSGGPFTYVYRDLDTEGTDGIADIQAWLDGFQLTEGTGPKHVQIDQQTDTTRITWHLPQTYDSTHTFVLAYRVWGIIRQEKAGPLLKWWTIPPEHGYGIEHATISLQIPASVQLENINLDIGFTLESGNSEVMTVSEKIYENRGVILTAQFLTGTLNVPMPAWQAESQQQANHFWSTMLLAAAITGLLVLLFWIILVRLLRENKQLLARHFELHRTPPGDLSPALAGKLVFNRDEPLATLLDVARRGYVQIQKLPKDRQTKKKFSYSIAHETMALQVHERRLLSMVRNGFGSGDPDIVTYDWVQDFKSRLKEDLEYKELIFKKPQGTRETSQENSSCILGISHFLGISLISLAWEFGFSSFVSSILIGLGWLIMGISTLAFLRSHLVGRSLPYTEKGYQIALAWRGFAEYLKRLAHGKEGVPSPDMFDHYLAYATAFGLLKPWINAFRIHTNLPQPEYFYISLNDSDYQGFDPYVFTNLSHATQAYSGGDSGDGGGGGGGGGGASGGGGSGAG